MEEKEKSILEGTIVSAAVLPNGELVEIENKPTDTSVHLLEYWKRISFIERYKGDIALYFKGIHVLDFNRSNGSVSFIHPEYIPFGLFLKETDELDKRVENINNFNYWCANRVLSLDRKYAKQILNHFGYAQSSLDVDKANIALFTRCVSLNDPYWTQNENENLSWDDVNIFKNSLENVVFEIALLGKKLTISNEELIGRTELVTDGTAPKAWKRQANDFWLLKGDVNDSVIREVEASQILNELGIPVTKYEYDSFEEMPVSKCKCFTNENVFFVRARIYRQWCEHNGKAFYQELRKYQEAFDLMNIGDYLIGNSDEHPENWGFLYDENMNIIGLNPTMDFDHAFESSENQICTPTLYTRGTVSQKQVALDTIEEYQDRINWDIDLSKYKYGSYVEHRLDILKKSLTINMNKVQTTNYLEQPPQESEPKLM